MLHVPPRRAYLGSDAVYYCENSTGHVFLTSPASPIPEGFVRKCAETVRDVEAVWAKLDAQEKAEHSRLTESDYERRKARIERMREFCQRRLRDPECSADEAFAITYALKFVDRKEAALMRNTVYGVADMQAHEAPLAPSSQVKVKVN